MLIMELENQERRLLLQVVEDRLYGMGPQIRRCRADRQHDELLAEQAALLRLADRLRPTAMTPVWGEEMAEVC
jgi:hypothetical protein